MALLHGNGRDDVGIAEAAVARTRSEPQRAIVIITKTGSVSERLVHALEREFPWVVVDQVGDAASACRPFAHPVSLILIDVPLVKEAEEVSASLAGMHPQALTAVIEPHDQSLATIPVDILASPLVRSVLPMNLRLDVWLSVIRLMLCGGEYFPPGMILHAKKNGHNTDSMFARRPAPVSATAGATPVAHLTTRELQILEMVSRGLQNKLIAAEFRLSEHTVKIHLHNIIRKLGAHNRTEAAARFRHFQEQNAWLPER
ncbi:response regulator transcription factor [Sinorhizobium sp. BG8]|uniref:helix-turn-helix domain-containing protein n=1 Tax=Sinorhizobium sp. BG8 TaxID=2613773 RepID=UPI00193D8A02|nr:response regulator transcription factor [Sinorhizobium sp. BG8]QRM57732.1 response regulator transcription factor [Sinorhizobium sp. BG8]